MNVIKVYILLIINSFSIFCTNCTIDYNGKQTKVDIDFNVIVSNSFFESVYKILEQKINMGIFGSTPEKFNRNKYFIKRIFIKVKTNIDYINENDKTLILGTLAKLRSIGNKTAPEGSYAIIYLSNRARIMINSHNIPSNYTTDLKNLVDIKKKINISNLGKIKRNDILKQFKNEYLYVSFDKEGKDKDITEEDADLEGEIWIHVHLKEEYKKKDNEINPVISKSSGDKNTDSKQIKSGKNTGKKCCCC